jgi:hypothetical protein
MIWKEAVVKLSRYYIDILEKTTENHEKLKFVLLVT